MFSQKEHAMSHLRRLFLGATATAMIAGGAVAVPAAHADYYLSQGGAQRLALRYVDEHYDVSGTIYAKCRPQFRNAPAPGYKYHRWLCGWSSSNGCSGRLLIAGSQSPGAYYARPSLANC
jgi:hypothetical protein